MFLKRVSWELGKEHVFQMLFKTSHALRSGSPGPRGGYLPATALFSLPAVAALLKLGLPLLFFQGAPLSF